MRNLADRKLRFWLEQPDHEGGWEKGVKDVDTTILYRVDEIRKTIEAGRIICIVEGEKDADNLWKLGIPATCNGMVPLIRGKKLSAEMACVPKRATQRREHRRLQ